MRKDIEAAIATVKALGYTSIVLEGHSLGTIQVEYYAATDWDRAIKAVILTGPFGKLPWKSRNIVIQDEDIYKALTESALGALKAGKPADLLSMKMPYLGAEMVLQLSLTAQFTHAGVSPLLSHSGR